MTDKEIVAVIFGGQSVEHDVSILTGLQIADAIDATRFEVVPVYIAPDGIWYTGNELLDRRAYPLTPEQRKGLAQVILAIGAARPARGLHPARLQLAGSGRPWGRAKHLDFDVAIPAIHGTGGEDGNLQGALESAGIPYAGSGTLASAAYMSKDFSKTIFAALDIPALPAATVPRPGPGSGASLRQLAEGVDLPFPLCVKPANLGSSVCVSRADDIDSMETALTSVFRADEAAIVEPFVANLVEYNVAVSRAFGEVRLSAIERPLRESELLDFADKYLAGGDMDSKLAMPFEEGMASATRVIDPPELDAATAARIRTWAVAAFNAVKARGSVRIDFLSNADTGEVWINEVNTCPGSLAYFLWEAADPPVTFTQLMTALIEEALAVYQEKIPMISPAEVGAGIFGRART